MHRDLELEPPAVGHWITAFRHGLAHDGADDRAADRTYLPPPVVAAVLDYALSGRAAARSPEVLRACVCTAFTFLFFARGDTGAGLLSEHVRRGPQGEWIISLAREKGKRRRARMRALTVPADAVPRITALLELWLGVRGDVRPGDSFYTLPSDRRRGARGAHVRFAATCVDGWLRLALTCVGASPPAGEKWTGHSLRKGAASGAAAIGVVIDRICHFGGWSIHSGVVHDYIDPACPASDAAYAFFGWLLPPHLACSVSVG